MTYDLRSNRYFLKALPWLLVGGKVLGYTFVALPWEAAHLCVTMALVLPLMQPDIDVSMTVSHLYQIAGIMATFALTLHFIGGLWPFHRLYR